jgi:hypothetical protein
MALFALLQSSKELEANLDSLGTWLTIFTFLVVLGLVAEYWHDAEDVFQEWTRPAACFPWKKFLELLGGIIVTLGVAGELYVQFKASGVETKLRASNNAEFLKHATDIKALGEISSKARLDAEAASVIAKTASDEADAAKIESGKSLVQAKEAESHLAESLRRANEAEAKSANAVSSSFTALDLARGARKEADTFEGRLKSAERLANDAVSQIQTAVRQAGEAVSELERMKLPRDFPHPETLRSAVLPFQGTRYNFSVFGDDESGAVLKKLAGILESAKWIREKQARIRIGITAYQTFGLNDLVEQCSDSGIVVEVEFPGGWEALNALPQDKWPNRVRVAIALNSALAANIFPPPSLPPQARATAGDSELIHIRVGRKP